MDCESVSNHNVVLYNRSRIELSGIIDVISFSENTVEFISIISFWFFVSLQ